jgi:peptide deformylase
MQNKYSIISIKEAPKSVSTPTKDLVLLFKTCNQMEKLCRENGGVGLHAIQVGLPWDLFIINRNENYEFYFDCSYEGIGNTSIAIEGCLSIKDETHLKLRRFQVARYSEVLVKGFRLLFSDVIKSEPFQSVEKGTQAVIFQHEIDHSSGISIADFGKEIQLIT